MCLPLCVSLSASLSLSLFLLLCIVLFSVFLSIALFLPVSLLRESFIDPTTLYVSLPFSLSILQCCFLHSTMLFFSLLSHSYIYVTQRFFFSHSLVLSSIQSFLISQSFCHYLSFSIYFVLLCTVSIFNSISIICLFLFSLVYPIFTSPFTFFLSF